MNRPEDFEIVLTAGQPSMIERRGRFFGIIVAPLAAINIELDGAPALRRGPGGSIMLPDFFRRIRLTSAVTQTVRVLVADEPQDVSNVTTGGGGGVGSEVSEVPSSTLASPAAVNVANNNTATIAANTARRRITVYAYDTNAGPIFLQVPAAGAGRGLGLAPGLFVELKTTAAIGVRNDSGAAADFSTLEES